MTKSKQGFTLIELLVVIGILAVLAAIAIPAVAGLIDRANISSDKTNANEMTNAVERFASEYELYKQDIASDVLDQNNLDSAQGRVHNVVLVTDRDGISELEKDTSVGTDVEGRAIYRDTKYPINAETFKAVVENYTKTSSSTFEPKQSDMHYWYSPDCGLVVFAKPNADVVADLNVQVISGKDAKGNNLTSETKWIDITADVSTSVEEETPDEGEDVVSNAIPDGCAYYTQTKICSCGIDYGVVSMVCKSCDYEYQVEGVSLTEFPESPSNGDIFVSGCFKYVFFRYSSGWHVKLNGNYDGTQILEEINNVPVVSMNSCFMNSSITDSDLRTINIPSTVDDISGAFLGCGNLVNASGLNIPSTVLYMDATFKDCYSLEVIPEIPVTVEYIDYIVSGCYRIESITVPCKFMGIENSPETPCEVIFNHSYNCEH